MMFGLTLSMFVRIRSRRRETETGMTYTSVEGEEIA